MAAIEDIGKRILDDSVPREKRLAALEEVARRPNPRRVRVLLWAMAATDEVVAKRARELQGDLVQELLRTAAGREIAYAETFHELLTALGLHLIEACVGLARGSGDAARTEAALKAARAAAEQLRKAVESAAPAEPKPEVQVKEQRFAEPSPQVAPKRLHACELTGQPFPDPEEFSGPGTIILLRPLEDKLTEASQELAEVCESPPIEIRNSLFQTKLIVRRDVPAERVPAVLEKLESMGQPAMAVEWERSLMPPDVAKALTFNMTSEGFEAQVQMPSGTETVSAAWDRVFLLCGVRIFRHTSKTVKVQRSRLLRKVQVDQTIPTTEELFILDMLLREPWRRVRLGEPLPDLSAMGIKIVGGGEIDARRTADEIVSGDFDVRANEGLAMLAKMGADLEPITFSGKHHVEHYETALIQLARFGLL